jgi:hypothetical protein
MFPTALTDIGMHAHDGSMDAAAQDPFDILFHKFTPADRAFIKWSHGFFVLVGVQRNPNASRLDSLNNV